MPAGGPGRWTSSGQPAPQQAAGLSVHTVSGGNPSYEPMPVMPVLPNSYSAPAQHASPPPQASTTLPAEPHTARASWVISQGIPQTNRSSVESSPMTVQRMGSAQSAQSLTAPPGGQAYQVPTTHSAKHSTVSLPSGRTMPSAVQSEEVATARVRSIPPVVHTCTEYLNPQRLSGAVRQGSLGGHSTASMPCSSPGTAGREMKLSLPTARPSEVHIKPDMERERRKSHSVDSGADDTEFRARMMQMVTEVHESTCKQKQQDDEDKTRRDNARAQLKLADGADALRLAIRQAEDCYMPQDEIQPFRAQLMEMDRQRLEKEAQERQQTDRKIADLTAKLHEANESRNEMRLQLEERNETLHQERAHQEEREKLRMEVESRLHREERCNSELRAELDEAMCKIQEHEARAHQAEAALAMRDQQAQASCRDSIQDLKEQNARLDHQCRSLTEENKSLQDQIGQWRIRFNTAQQNLDARTVETEEHKRKTGELQKERREQEGKLREMTKMNQAKEQEVKKLREMRLQEEQQAIDDRSQKAQLEECNRQQQERIRYLEDHVENLKDHAENLKEFREAAKKAGTIEKENRNLKQTIQDQKKVMHSLQSEQHKDQVSASFITPGEFFKLHQEQAEKFKSDFSKLAALESQNHQLNHDLHRARQETKILRKHLPESSKPTVETELVATYREPVPEPAF